MMLLAGFFPYVMITKWCKVVCSGSCMTALLFPTDLTADLATEIDCPQRKRYYNTYQTKYLIV